MELFDEFPVHNLKPHAGVLNASISFYINDGVSFIMGLQLKNI
jgi:hypothetical protein